MHSVLLTLHFSFMSYMISEIYFDCKIKYLRSILLYLIFPICNWLELICINCIVCSVLLTIHFSLMSKIISKIYFDSRLKSSCKEIPQLTCYREKKLFWFLYTFYVVEYFVEGWIVPNDILVHP